MGFVGIADDPFDAVHFREFFGRALGVAAGDEDAGGGILATNAADGGSRVVIRSRGDRAGVQDDDVGGFAGLGVRESAVGKLRFERGSVGLGGATSEILNEETRGGTHNFYSGRTPLYL